VSTPRSPRTLIALVRDLQGTDSQMDFASRLGMDQGDLSRFLSGRKRAGRNMIVGLLREFPDRRDEIVEAVTGGVTPDESAVA
jgi:hypothetical protein